MSKARSPSRSLRRRRIRRSAAIARLVGEDGEPVVDRTLTGRGAASDEDGGAPAVFFWGSPVHRVLQRSPPPILFRARHALRDEVHAVHAVSDVGIEAFRSVECPAADSL